MADRALLKRRVARALVRDDIEEEEANAWVDSATARISRSLRNAEMLRHRVLTLSAASFVLPDDFLEARELRVGTNPAGGASLGTVKGTLLYTTPAELTSLYGEPNPTNDLPGYYTIRGNELEIIPWAVPSGEYQISLWYFAKLPALAADTATNTVLENYQDLYLSATLIYGHRFYLEDDKALLKEGLVAQECQELNDRFREAKYGDGPLVARAARKLGGRYS